MAKKRHTADREGREEGARLHLRHLTDARPVRDARSMRREAGCHTIPAHVPKTYERMNASEIG